MWCALILAMSCHASNQCKVTSDCAAPEICVAFVCHAPTCSDNVRNGSESDVDCGGGGNCALCDSGRACGFGRDCASGICISGLCSSGSCGDGARNGHETDIDCGGECAPCGNGKSCQSPSDCVAKICAQSLCVDRNCTNGLKDGSETDIDCGGKDCAPCADGSACALSTDCASLSCSAAVCLAPSCSDGQANGNESDVDCGGTCAAPCSDGQACASSSDCRNRVCTAHICSSCTTDGDCGTSSECRTVSCSNGACTVTNVPASTALAQVAGDCATRRCDGNGAIVTSYAAGDVPSLRSNVGLCAIQATCQATFSASTSTFLTSGPSNDDCETPACGPSGPYQESFACGIGECVATNQVKACVACRTVLDCPLGHPCVTGACLECADDTQCSGVCDVGSGQCRPCGVGTPCASGKFCDATTHTCEACAAAAQCVDTANGRCITQQGSSGDPSHCGANGAACVSCGGNPTGSKCINGQNGFACGCSLDRDCDTAPNGPRCQGQKCGCFQTQDCAGSPQGSACVSNGSANVCGCSSDSDCSGSLICNFSTHRCG